MSRELTYLITEENIGTSPLTIHGFLKGRGYSHAVLVSLKKTPEGILKNGVWARVHDTLSPGDRLLVRLAEEKTSDHIVPRPLPFPVIYEDEDLLIVNKPADMPIHPSQGNYENTLANFCQKGESFVYRCINRLDRDTTGLLILAKHAYSAALLSRMVTDRKIHREYLAVTKGVPDVSGIVDAPIGRKDGSTIERQIDFVHGETARTHYELLTSEYLGYPLPGDFLYCPDYTKIRRQALHSYRLSFLHPISQKPLSFTASLPDDMRAFFSASTLELL